MNQVYTAYGLHLSSDVPIPGLVASRAFADVDVEVWLYTEPSWLVELADAVPEIFYISPSESEQGTPTLTVWRFKGSDYFRLMYCDGTEFIVDGLGKKIRATWPDPLTLEDTTTYLLGPVLGFVLRLRGVTALHASAVAIGKQAIAFLGPAGAGKSTIAARFARLDFPVLCDDVVPLIEQNGKFLAQPGYPRLNLWPEAVSALYGSPDALPLMTPNWSKRYAALNDNGHRFQSEPLPLAATYILGERGIEPACPIVEAVPPHGALMALVSNTYLNYVLDEAMRAREFDLLGRLVGRVPVRMVRPHADLAYPKRLCEVIVEDFHTLTSPAATVQAARQS